MSRWKQVTPESIRKARLQDAETYIEKALVELYYEIEDQMGGTLYGSTPLTRKRSKVIQELVDIFEALKDINRELYNRAFPLSVPQYEDYE